MTLPLLTIVARPACLKKRSVVSSSPKSESSCVSIDPFVYVHCEGVRYLVET